MFAFQPGIGGLTLIDRFCLDAVIDPYRLLPNGKAAHTVFKRSSVMSETHGDCIDIAKTLLENDAIEDELRKAEVHRNLIGIQIMQRHHRWATERSCIHRHGIGEMDQIDLQLSGQFRKRAVVPEIPAERALVPSRRRESRAGDPSESLRPRTKLRCHGAMTRCRAEISGLW